MSNPISGSLPEPLVPAEVDLRDFAFMPLDVIRLRDSDLTVVASDAEFRSAVLLWCACWHQVPAASLPDDDRLLAALAGLGRGEAALNAWRDVREGALRNYVKCSDGRLYHRVIAQKALEAWQEKAAYRERKAAFAAKQSDRAKSRWQKEKGQTERPHHGDTSSGPIVTPTTTEGQGEPAPDATASATASAEKMPMKGTGTGTGTGIKKKNTPSSPHAATVPLIAEVDAALDPSDGGGKASKRIAYPEAFSRFWAVFPRQTHKLAALRAWERAVKHAGGGDEGVQRIEQAAEAYRRAKSGSDPRYVPHPATWLNAGAWDDPEPVPGTSGAAARPGYVPMGNV